MRHRGRIGLATFVVAACTMASVAVPGASAYVWMALGDPSLIAQGTPVEFAGEAEVRFQFANGAVVCRGASALQGEMDVNEKVTDVIVMDRATGELGGEQACEGGTVTAEGFPWKVLISHFGKMHVTSEPGLRFDVGGCVYTPKKLTGSLNIGHEQEELVHPSLNAALSTNQAGCQKKATLTTGLFGADAFEAGPIIKWVGRTT